MPWPSVQMAIQSSTVILVDDDFSVRDSVKTYLESSDISVITYDSASDCLLAFRAKDCACIIIDLRLSDMNGLDLLEALLDRDGSIASILISADISVAARKRAADLGVRVVLKKPFAGSAILAAIQEVLGIRST